MAAVYGTGPVHASEQGYSSSRAGDDLWMVLWKLQRQEVSTRLSIETTEKNERKDIGVWEPMAPAAGASREHGASPVSNLPVSQHPMYNSDQPQQQLTSTGKPSTDLLSAAQIEKLRREIANLSEDKQILLSEYILAKYPHAIFLDPSGVASIDPYALQGNCYEAVMDHMHLLAADTAEKAAFEEPQQYTGPSTYPTGYQKGPPRGPMPRPPMGPPAAGYGQPHAAAPPPYGSYYAAAPPYGQDYYSPADRNAMAPVPRLPPIQPLSDAESRARKDLARRVQLLTEAAQKTVSQEVRIIAPYAVTQPSPGYSTINMEGMESSAFLRVAQLVTDLEIATHQDKMREQERLARRQAEREHFIQRERARERERYLDMEREKRIREQQVMEDLERDLALVRAEADKELQQRWHYGKPNEGIPHNLAGRLMTASMETGPLTDDELFQLRLKLHDTLRGLKEHHLLTFADFVMVIQPDAIVDNAVQPSNFKATTIRPILSFALQLQAEQTIEGVTAKTGDDDSNSLPPSTYSHRGSVLHSPKPPSTKPESASGRHAAPSCTPPLDAYPDDQQSTTGLSTPELRMREQLSGRILGLPKAQQKAVCTWLQGHSPQAINTTTSIDTQYMDQARVQELEALLASLEAADNQ